MVQATQVLMVKTVHAVSFTPAAAAQAGPSAGRARCRQQAMGGMPGCRRPLHEANSTVGTSGACALTALSELEPAGAVAAGGGVGERGHPSTFCVIGGPRLNLGRPGGRQHGDAAARAPPCPQHL